MIATAAYMRAEQRRFVGGDPMADWLAAEAEVNQSLAAQRQEKERERAAFERMYKEVRHALEEVRDKVSAQTIQDALEKASAVLREAGEYTGDTVSKVTEAVKKDLAITAVRLAPT
jgi:DNA repair exonuclease SbcCD ATPase subunit